MGAIGEDVGELNLEEYEEVLKKGAVMEEQESNTKEGTGEGTTEEEEQIGVTV